MFEPAGIFQETDSFSDKLSQAITLAAVCVLVGKAGQCEHFHQDVQVVVGLARLPRKARYVPHPSPCERSFLGGERTLQFIRMLYHQSVTRLISFTTSFPASLPHC